MEISDVLTQYVQLFGEENRQFKLYFAPNCVLDWFGRTVKGPIKIHDYLRQEVCSQYEHVDFEKAEMCGPIECRPSHEKTKIQPTGDIDLIPAKNKVDGLTSLKLYADSDMEDVEDDDMGLQPLPDTGNKTPEHVSNPVIEELTPPSSTVKKEQNSDSDSESDDDAACTFTKVKRMKRSHPSPFSYLRRLPISTASTRKAINEDGMRSLLEETSDDEDERNVEGDASNEYSPMQYLETKGVLRSILTQRHESDVTNTSAGSWDREVRMRISYRYHKSKKEPQFVLIIYEHLNGAIKTTTTRRNLMTEFVDVANEVTGDNVTGVDDNNDNERQLSMLVTDTNEINVANSSEAIIDALESATFTIVPFRTPTKQAHTPPATPKRKPRLPYGISGVKRLNLSTSATTSSASSSSAPKRSAVRSLRL